MELVLFLIIIIVIKLIWKSIKPKIKGKVGEERVTKKLYRLPDEYLILNDVLIENNGITHQIDHIVISKYGIFVIETKNYTNIITGSSKASEWTQHIWTNKYKFRNPLLQNYGHIKTLENTLGLDFYKFKSIVCFPNDSKLKIKDADNVKKIKDLIPYIESFEKVIVYENINTIYEAIKKIDITDKKIRSNHSYNVKSKIKKDEELVYKNICPKCGSKLVLRNGKYGEFMGCSNYPKCRFIAK